MVTIPRHDYREGRRFILCDLVHDKRLLKTPIVVLDVGARDAFAHTPWIALPPDMVRLHGFEPDPPECAALNRKAEAEGLDFHFHPIALGDHTGRVDFYQYAEQAANSFYPPNRALVERFCYGRGLPLSSQFELIAKQAIETKSMADWAREAGVTAIDFCKLNIQGAELEVLRAAGPLLDSVLGIVAEQTFNPTYLGAPLFGEVYEFIRGAGFTLFDVIGMNRVARTHSPIHITEDRIFSLKGVWPHHQLLEGHFLYYRDPILAAGHSGSVAAEVEQCIKLACIAELFGQVEFAFELLSWIAASPQAGEIGSRCREIVGRGTELYIEASRDPSPPRNLSTSEFWERENGRLAAENNRLLTDLTTQAIRVAELEAKLASREDEVFHLYASSSWRITAPFRGMKGLFDEVRKRFGNWRQ
jgi:FkbM family methyltransferase